MRRGYEKKRICQAKTRKNLFGNFSSALAQKSNEAIMMSLVVVLHAKSRMQSQRKNKAVRSGKNQSKVIVKSRFQRERERASLRVGIRRTTTHTYTHKVTAQQKTQAFRYVQNANILVEKRKVGKCKLGLITILTTTKLFGLLFACILSFSLFLSYSQVSTRGIRKKTSFPKESNARPRVHVLDALLRTKAFEFLTLMLIA